MTRHDFSLRGLAGFRTALLADFGQGYEQRKRALFESACRYKRSGGKPGSTCSPPVYDRICEFQIAARRLWHWCCDWAALAVLPELDLECPGCCLVAAVLDLCAAQDAGEQHTAQTHCRRALLAALVLATSMEQDRAPC